MIKRLLIANRGEIACRIIRTARRLGIYTIAVYSEADTNSLHVKMADKAIYIGASPVNQSYLNKKAIMEAIKISGADAVHPGYGFLSENAEFVQMLEKHRIAFVGPSSDAIKKMGDKIEAKKIAQSAGVNVVPGYLIALKSVKDAIKTANKIGYPVMLKAAAGGGGKGMRVVRSDSEMEQSFSSTRNEARNNFSDERTFIEKYIENPRHIEIQLLGDKHGNYVCLGERECSIQRHHQKVIEEAPSAFLDEKTRLKMYKQSVALGKKVKYHSVGTVEYIVDSKRNFYFMEMNTRLQVEHPVTELITGYDLVEQMIKVTNGDKLAIKQKDVKFNGWAFESRVYAEDPSSGFIPSTGQIHTYKEPEKNQNIRIDTGIFEGCEVSMYYDAMISKLCTHAPTRVEAIETMKNALGKFIIRGVSSNISFLQTIFNHQRFINGDISTKFIEQEFKEGFMGASLSDEDSAVILASAVFIHMSSSKRDMEISGQVRGFSKYLGTRWVVRLDGQNFPIASRPIEDGYKVSFENRRLFIQSKWILGTKLFECVINGRAYSLQVESTAYGHNLTYQGRTVRVEVLTPRSAELKKFLKSSTDVELSKDIKSNMSGKIVAVKVEEGAEIQKGQPAVILEAMKMENIILAPANGKVGKIYFKEGDSISAGEVIAEVA